MRRSVFILLISVPLLFGIVALLLGQDSNWDLRNYHWYNAYALLHDRLEMDMGAAQIPTFYNPALDLPFFLAADLLSAKPYSFLLGALQGCNFILLYMIAVRVLKIESPRMQTAASAAIAFVGMIGAGQMAQVGAAFYDNIVSLFIFAAILVVLHNKNMLERGSFPRALSWAALAGFLVGFAVGLKLPTQIFAVGVCFGLLFIPGPFVRRFFLSFICGLGVIGGFALSGGWWMWYLWAHFGNPLFPYFNDVIHSLWALPASYRDDRFLPKTLVEAVLLPFRLFVDAKVGGEIAFRDARILGAYVILVATAVMLLIKRLEKTETVTPPFADVFAARYLAAVAALSYAVWLKLFGIYRYALPLEMLAPLIVVACLAFWPVRRQRQLSLAIGVLGFMVITMQPGDWGRKPWAPGLGGKLVDVTVPPINDPANTLVLMTGFAPTSFVIPAFPPEIPFLRPHSYLVAPGDPTKFNEVMNNRIVAHQGNVLLVRARWETWPVEKVLPGLGLRLVPESCRPLPANLDDELELCGLTKAVPLSAEP